VVRINRAGFGTRDAFRIQAFRYRYELPSVFAALDKVKFRGWAVVELDRVPDKSRTPKESATISKTYLEQKIGVTV
jgi:inosose dehydratase